MNQINAHRFLFSIVIPVGVLMFVFAYASRGPLTWNNLHKRVFTSTSDAEDAARSKDEKHRGVHIFGSLNAANMETLLENNIDWVTLVPFIYQDDVLTSNVLYYRGDRADIDRRDSIWTEKICVAHDAGLKVFFKPHIWLTGVTDGKWRSDIYPESETVWKEWQKKYRESILFYAQIAEKNEVEMFCIGAELSRLTTEKSEFWRALIPEIREVYSGKLTYAANWYNEFEEIGFWDELDFIGVQAYFPLTDKIFPTVDQISKGWKPHISSLKRVHDRFGRKVLFTEMGYKSIANSAARPWEWIYHMEEEEKRYSPETQSNCFEAFFTSVWDKDWFAGVHIWQMRAGYDPERAIMDLDFTPQGKPAELILREGFKR